MKNKISLAVTIIILLAIFIGLDRFIASDVTPDYKPENSEANIVLIGEAHGIQEFYDIELEEWGKCYEAGMRDLFLEHGYFTSELLNVYMKSNDDKILYQLYDNLENTSQHTQMFIDFFSSIKEKYPETVFHGTDLGHQYDSSGVQYLKYLEENGLKDSYNYEKTLAAMEQGRKWYEELDCDNEYREKCMVDNFIEEYDRIGNIPILGIYGGYHTNINGNVMAGMLKEHYGDIIETRLLENIKKKIEPYKIGFCITGVAMLILLFVPNIIFGIRVPEELNEIMQNENKVLLMLERVGQVLATTSLVIFKSIDPHICSWKGILITFPRYIACYVIAVIVMALYEAYWIRYFLSENKTEAFFKSIAGIPLPGALCPCVALILLGIHGQNLIVIASAIILTIGHVGIHYTDLMRYKKMAEG